MLQDCIEKVLESIPETDHERFTSKLIHYIEGYTIFSKVEDFIDNRVLTPDMKNLHIHIPACNISIYIPVTRDENPFPAFEDTEYVEFVNKEAKQKLAMKLLDNEYKALEIKKLFEKYLEYLSGRYRDVTFTKVTDGYEIIVPFIIVNNSELRKKFIGNFILWSDDKSIGRYIDLSDTIHDYDMYLSINALKYNDHPVDQYLVSYIFEFDSERYDSIPRHHNPKLYALPANVFITHIRINKPKWYVPDSWITIDDFYDKYLPFEATAKKESFAEQFKGILWSDIQIDQTTKYLLMNLED